MPRIISDFFIAFMLPTPLLYLLSPSFFLAFACSSKPHHSFPYIEVRGDPNELLNRVVRYMKADIDKKMLYIDKKMLYDETK